MGARGPAPLPTPIREGRGRSHHAQPSGAEPTLPVVELEPPARFKGDALATWRRFMPVLVEMRVLTEADYMTLVVYCDAVATYEQATRRLARGRVSRTTGMPSPWAKIAKDAEETMKAFGDRLGLNAAARSRIKVSSAPVRDAFDEKYG